MIVTHVHKARSSRLSSARAFWPAIMGVMALIGGVGGTILAMRG